MSAPYPSAATRSYRSPPLPFGQKPLPHSTPDKKFLQRSPDIFLVGWHSCYSLGICVVKTQYIFYVRGSLYLNVQLCLNCNFAFHIMYCLDSNISLLKIPRNVPYGQCLSPSQFPPKLPPSLLLPSPPLVPKPASCQQLTVHFDPPPGSSLRQVVVQSS